MIHLTALMDEDLEAILKIAIFPCLLNLFHFKSSHQFCFNRLLHQWGFISKLKGIFDMFLFTYEKQVIILKASFMIADANVDMII